MEPTPHLFDIDLGVNGAPAVVPPTAAAPAPPGARTLTELLASAAVVRASNS